MCGRVAAGEAGTLYLSVQDRFLGVSDNTSSSAAGRTSFPTTLLRPSSVSGPADHNVPTSARAS
ncbi:hypothetical protein E2C01_040194 [Portunus trituberculatus]|uniref:Uncharacterized protein n=1 Tax=Portunus trituberculatus TaxID=210409 RepID=A0A5B7FQ26_PORTR|nr:hypothetical protein [Portunus trituberculatus]